MAWVQLINTYADYVISSNPRAWFHRSFDNYATYPVTNDWTHACRSGTAIIISVYVQGDHQVSVSKELFMTKEEHVKQILSLLSYHLTA